jgi:hypothetical protein
MRSGRPPRLTWCDEDCSSVSLDSVVSVDDQYVEISESVCLSVGTANQNTTQLGVPRRVLGAENLNNVCLL